MANSEETREFAKDTAVLRQKFLDDTERARRMVIASPELNANGTTTSALETLKTAFPAQLDAVRELANAGDWTAVRLRLAHQIEDLRDLSVSRLEDVFEQLTEAQNTALATTRQARRNLFLVVPMAALLTLLAAAVLGWHLSRSITVPLSQLASGARALARGDFQQPVNVGGNDELAILGRTFNQTARQLQELYQEMREQASLLSLTHDSIYVQDKNSIIRYWNRGAELLYLWSAEEAVGEVAHEFLKTVFPVPFEQIEAELLRSGRWEGELSQSRKDGTQVVVAARWSMKRDEQGAPVAVLVTTNDITARKQAQENLRRNEAYLAEAQTLSHTGSWAFSPVTMKTHYWSDETFRIWGFDPQHEPPTQEQLYQRIHPEDRSAVEAMSDKAVREKTDLEYEFRIVLPDGTVKHVHTTLHVVLDAKGDIAEFIGTNVDVTEAKRAQEALRESETRFRTFVDHAGDALFVYDLEQRTVVDVNREACESLGYTRQEIIGKAPIAFHPDSYQAEMEAVAERAAAGETVFDTHWHRRKDGTLFPVEVHTSRVLYGGRQYLLMVARDISDRLRAEEAVRQSEKQLREVIETMPAIAWTMTSDGSLEFVNKRWQEYTGMSSQEAAGFGWKSAFHPKDIDRYLERRRVSLESGSLFEDEVRIRSRGGEYRWFISRAVPLRDEQGNIIRWYGTATDIHDRKEAEERLHVENVVLREEIDKASMFEEVVGASPALQKVLLAVAKVAPTDSTVLLTGQTGTGKELIARAIHRKSERSGRAFISVNCAAIPQSLIASELFGHEKGAFTGALQRHLGKFELAEGGTIFLDEIGELPMETQVALLRVLQEREIQRVGGTQPIRVNVRILAATNRDLQKAIAAGTFREDLFYRFNVFPIHVPPLRERKEDIPMLVEYFIDRFARKAGKKIRSIDKLSLELLESYSWPGNIRELQNVVERSVVLCDTDSLRIDSSWLSVADSGSPGATRSLANKIQEQEREFIERALAEAEGKVSGPSGAAAKLGISPSALEYKIRLLKINKHQFKKYLRET
ncbi:MAG TPA: sigma 54-interacting transcriptional regulator [Terriglobales bacterium]|nr:sigma 54-interacting transcriptional regulator [Terriglobales bacterium]